MIRFALCLILAASLYGCGRKGALTRPAALDAAQAQTAAQPSADLT